MAGETLHAEAHSTITHMTTRNVIGVVRGSKHPGDYVLYTAHWDHLGTKPDVAGPDKIYNGAVDNGLGVSGILEIAEAFTHSKARPQRSIAFICWTMEEQGLLGSQYFAEHPLWPLNHIVGGINLDANLPEGRAHDLVLVGRGSSQLEDLLAKVLEKQHRVLTPDPEPEKGHFYRSDHFSLAKVGVPMLAPAGGHDLSMEEPPRVKPSPTITVTIAIISLPTSGIRTGIFRGRSRICRLYYEFGRELANSNAWPDWYSDDEFRATRDKSMSQR